MGLAKTYISALLSGFGSWLSWKLLKAAERVDRSGFPDKAALLLGQTNPKALRKFVADQALKNGAKATMVILDREKIMHCFACPERFSLRKVGGLYACKLHTQEVQVKVA